MVARLFYAIRYAFWLLGNLRRRLGKPPEYVAFMLEGPYPELPDPPAGFLRRRPLSAENRAYPSSPSSFRQVAYDRRVRGVALHLRTPLHAPLPAPDAARPDRGAARGGQACRLLGAQLRQRRLLCRLRRRRGPPPARRIRPSSRHAARLPLPRRRAEAYRPQGRFRPGQSLQVGRRHIIPRTHVRGDARDDRLADGRHARRLRRCHRAGPGPRRGQSAGPGGRRPPTTTGGPSRRASSTQP